MTRRRLSPLALESRVVPAVAFDYHKPAPLWFGRVADDNAGPTDLDRQWLVRLSPDAAAPIAAVADTQAYFDPELFRVQSGLGLPGQLLLTSSAPVPTAAAALAANPHLTMFEPNYPVESLNQPNDPSFLDGNLWGLNNTGVNAGGQPIGQAGADINAVEAWQYTTGSDDIVVAVIDSGIDLDHPDLIDNLWVNPGEIPGNGLDDDGNGFIDDVNGWNFAADTNDPTDVNGHGSHVSGTIAGVGNNNRGVSGVAWSAKILGLNSGNSSFGAYIESINYATLMANAGANIRVSNNSYGSYSFSQSAYDAISAHVQAGILVVAAAGNDSFDNDTAFAYPASYDLDGILSVAASDRSDARANFSNYGKTTVDLAAPGVSIYSTVPGGGYVWKQGTSMASPHAAGAAVLVSASDPSLTPQQIRQRLIDTVDPLPDWSGKVLSGGRLNVGKAVAASYPTSVVTNTLDAGPGSLRQAVAGANAAGTTAAVRFDPVAFASAQTITLTTGPIAVTNSVLLIGPGAELLTINGGKASGVFAVGHESKDLAVSVAGFRFADAAGSAITNRDEALTVRDSVFADNTGGDGAAIRLDLPGGRLTIDDSRFLNNAATGSGGAIAAKSAATITVDRSTVEMNQAANGGGIALLGGGNLSVTNSTLSANSVTATGGGVRIDGTGDWLIRNSTLSANAAATGGGIALTNANGPLVVQNSTLTQNKGNGGGIAQVGGSATILLESTAVAGNVHAGQPDLLAANLVTAKFSAIGSSAGAANFAPDAATTKLLGLAPLLGPLADNGGPTKTHALLAGSPLTDAGSNPAGLKTDQRGGTNFRVIGSAADIGAYEDFVSQLNVTNTLDTGTGSLRQAVQVANAVPGAQTITFAPGLSGTITLTTGQMTITDAVTLAGPGPGVLTVSGNNASRLFEISVGSSVPVTFTGLTLTGGAQVGGGGAILIHNGILTVENSVVTKNTTGNNGGAILFLGNTARGRLTVRDSVLSSNSAGESGGAIYADSLESLAIEITRSALDGNTAGKVGGAVRFRQRLRIDDSTLSNNVAAGDGGGAVWATGQFGPGFTPMVIRNSTLSGNSTHGNGGAVLAKQAFGQNGFVLENSTVVNNTAKGALGGGGLATEFGGVGVALRSSVVALNTATANANEDISWATGEVTAEHTALGTKTGIATLMTDATTEYFFGANPTNFFLGPLADNGGPTKTHLPGPNSLLIGKGSNAAELAHDQRGPGFVRNRSGSSDVGAVEAATPLVVSSTADSGLGSLRDAILQANASAGPDTIIFDPVVFATPRTITLTTGELVAADDLLIDGPGANRLTVVASKAARVLRLDAPGQGNFTVRGLTIAGGHVTGDGGGINAGDDHLVLDGVHVRDNTAGQNGGGVAFSGPAALTVVASTISGNSASGPGGGIYLPWGNAVTIDRSTVHGNKSLSHGGGISLDLATGKGIGLTVRDATITGNSANQGGGIYAPFAAGAVTLERAIVAENTATSAADLRASATNVSYSLIGISDDGFTFSSNQFNKLGTKASPLDPLLNSLADSGGPTPTRTLKLGSPAIDAAGLPGLAFDQRGPGFPRQLADAADTGAVEFHDLQVRTLVNGGVGSLRQAIVNANAIGGPDTVTFDPAVFATPQTIVLTGQHITIAESLTVQGLGADKVVISGNKQWRIFNTEFATAATNVVIEGVTLTNGKVTGNGGAIVAGAHPLTIRDSVLIGNSATLDGGAIAVTQLKGKLTLERVAVMNNTAGDDGGGVFASGNDLRIVASTLSGNVATDKGGGAYFVNYSSQTTWEIAQSTVSGNQAKTGGGIAMQNTNDPLVIENSTITANHATVNAGGLHRQTGKSAIDLNSSILAGNTSAGTSADVLNNGTPFSYSHSAIGSATGLTGGVDAGGNLAFGTALKLGPLANNGGPTLTHLPATDSPLVNKGTNLAGWPTDQRGQNRVSGGAPDIGSVEVQFAAPPTATVTINGGSPQRSMVTQVAVTFLDAVTFPGGLSAAFTLTRIGPGSPTGSVPLTFTQAGQVVTLTFADPTYSLAGSLIDGKYALTLNAAKIQGVGGNLDGNGDGTGGDDLTANFHRFFGDGDGTGTVNFADFLAFRATFGRKAADAGFDAAFDADANGAVDFADFLAFRSRFGTALP